MEKNACFKTRAEIAKELNISTKTLNRHLQNMDLSIPPRQLISPALYHVIIERLHIIMK